MGNWKERPATPVQMAFVKALSGRDCDELTKGKATSIVRNKVNKIRKKVRKIEQSK